MAHCTYAELSDLEPALAALRAWPELREPKPGTFYWRGKGFLHFHSQAGRRWADIRDGADWGAPVDLPAGADAAAQAAFLAEARARLARCLGVK